MMKMSQSLREKLDSRCKKKPLKHLMFYTVQLLCAYGQKEPGFFRGDSREDLQRIPTVRCTVQSCN